MSDWIEWHGGECPVDGDVYVEIRTKDGMMDAARADCYFWGIDDKGYDIIAYRLYESDDRNAAVSAGPFVEPQPNIEQLAADYRAKLATYEQAQEELNSHRCGVEAALSRLEIAGAQLGFDIKPHEKPPTVGGSVIDRLRDEAATLSESVKQEFTDWRDLRIGDVVECVRSNIKGYKHDGQTGVVSNIDNEDEETPILVKLDHNDTKVWCHRVKLIRRP